MVETILTEAYAIKPFLLGVFLSSAYFIYARPSKPKCYEIKEFNHK